jgi:dephospho-CoA kinase
VILHVGLTGGIASGKSTVRELFAKSGCITVDADAVVASLYEPGAAGHAAIVGAYGTEVLREDQTIDRAKLSALAFASRESAQRLNALIHPLVIAEESRIAAEEERRRTGEDVIAVVEATLLLEAGGKQRYDKIVVVDLDPEVQLGRAVARGMSRDEAARRMAHQLAREERLRQADYIIDNSHNRASLQHEFERVHAALLHDLAEKKNASGSRPRHPSA